MPSGKTHDFISFCGLIPLGISSTVLYGKSLCDLDSLLLFLGGYLFGSLMFGPDLDIHSIQYKRWNIFRFIWIPYRKLGHRSSISRSHDIIWGFVIRVAYLAICIFPLIYLIFSWKYPNESFQDALKDYALQYQHQIICMLAGIWLGNSLHILADWSCDIKKFFSRMFR